MLKNYYNKSSYNLLYYPYYADETLAENIVIDIIIFMTKSIYKLIRLIVNK